MATGSVGQQVGEALLTAGGVVLLSAVALCLLAWVWLILITLYEPLYEWTVSKRLGKKWYG